MSELTPTNIQNLTKLRDFLANKVEADKFHMGSYMHKGEEGWDYCEYDIEDRRQIHNCGTAACAVGYGPSAGIRVRKEDKDWNVYAERVFGFRTLCVEWRFMFSDAWKLFDNTPQGAAKRIYYVIEHGKAPVDWVYKDPFPGQPK